MALYLPRHDNQFEPRTWSSPLDCNMAAAADAARYATLGLVDHGHNYYRDLTGDKVGGTNIDQAHDVLDKVGVSATAWDGADGKTWADVRAAIAHGPIIAHGDYGQVPPALRGAIDRSFTGNHSVYVHSGTYASGAWTYRIGDGLSDPWMTWPAAVLEGYLRGFPGTGLTYLTLETRRVCAKVPVANVRKSATRDSRVIGTLTPKSRVHGGGTVRGERIGLNATWIRVWVNDQIGYVHTSVGRWA